MRIPWRRQALAIDPNSVDVEAWRNRAARFIQLGLLPEAAADYARAFELQEPVGSVVFLQHALLRRSVGDDAGYRDACQRMMARFANSTDPNDWLHIAAALAYAPEPAVEPSLIVTFAERAVADHKTVWRVAYLGMAYLRAGQFERAAASLKESLAIDANWNPPGVYSAVAMAHHRLNSPEKAPPAFHQARRARDQRIEAMLGGDVGYWPGAWWDIVHGELLYNEAYALIQGSLPPEDARPLVLRGRAVESLAAQTKPKPRSTRPSRCNLRTC